MVHIGLMTTPNRQTVRSQNARGSIVQAALTVFALKGYAAASMDDVCMAAGCSKGGLYHHFRTKNALLRGVVARLTQTGALAIYDAVQANRDAEAAGMAALMTAVAVAALYAVTKLTQRKRHGW